MKLSISQLATLACMLEATASKPGNVHRGSDFDDVTFGDFAISAVAIGPAMESARERGVGEAVLAAVQATRGLVATNTNLGMVLLLAPLAAVPREQALRTGIVDVLARLTARDAALVYEAIAHAKPGGLGKSDQHDVAGAAPPSLLAAMQLAAGRDSIAKQYVTDFVDVFERVAQRFIHGTRRGWSLTDSIIHTHVQLLAEQGDTLIARKCGQAVSDEAAALAKQVLTAGQPGEENYYDALGDLDFWLRLDGHRRNPGTTADLIAAGLFVVLREEQIAPPWR